MFGPQKYILYYYLDPLAKSMRFLLALLSCFNSFLALFPTLNLIIKPYDVYAISWKLVGGPLSTAISQRCSSPPSAPQNLSLGLGSYLWTYILHCSSFLGLLFRILNIE